MGRGSHVLLHYFMKTSNFSSTRGLDTVHKENFKTLCLDGRNSLAEIGEANSIRENFYNLTILAAEKFRV